MCLWSRYPTGLYKGKEEGGQVISATTWFKLLNNMYIHSKRYPCIIITSRRCVHKPLNCLIHLKFYRSTLMTKTFISSDAWNDDSDTTLRLGWDIAAIYMKVKTVTDWRRCVCILWLDWYLMRIRIQEMVNCIRIR